MDQTFDMLQKLISQLEIQEEVINQEDMNLKLLRSLPSECSSSTSQNSQNVAFVSNSTNNTNNTNKADDTAHGVSTTNSTTHTQGNGVNSICLDNLCDAVICAFLARDGHADNQSKKVYQENREEAGHKWSKSFRNLGVQWKRIIQELFEWRSYSECLDSQDEFEDRIGATNLESIEARLAPIEKERGVEESINVLKLEVRLRDNALNEYKMNLEKAEKERDHQVINKFKTGLGYDAATTTSPTVESFVNLTDKSRSDKGYHSVPPPLTGNFIHRKPDLTFVDEIVESENLDVTIVVTHSNAKTVENKGVSNTVESNAVRMNNTSAPIIEDWNSDDESEIDYIVRPSTEKIKSVKTVRETDAPKQNPRGTKEIGTILCPKD
ncbi:hypothetical protein Tco_0977477 [Tanacetum coccineum]|uniref:Uncharacterized protein n=1 Tax=Tanacetum coccineum TaxID=301880 RepID=A0ABQ5EK86_9ASTR